MNIDNFRLLKNGELIRSTDYHYHERRGWTQFCEGDIAVGAPYDSSVNTPCIRENEACLVLDEWAVRAIVDVVDSVHGESMLGTQMIPILQMIARDFPNVANERYFSHLPWEKWKNYKDEE